MSTLGCRSWLSLARPSRRSGARGRKSVAARRLQVEQVEERVVPSGTPLDLTLRGATGMTNGAIFQQFDARPTGTGVIDSFVRLQAPNAKTTVQQGYNTDARPLQFDENHSRNFTRSLRLNEVPQVNIGGLLYREFLLDINQKSSQPYLSLDELRLYLADAPNLTGYDAATKTLGGYQSLYDLDAGTDNWVKLDYRLNSGSGSGDMLFYVPESALVRNSDNPHVYLYSKFGVNLTGNAGFEEWAAGAGLVAPATGSISGMKFNDLDRDGVRDANEPGLRDWVIYIDANANNELDPDEVYTITNENGDYTFTKLAAGVGSFSVYRIREVQQDGWTQTTLNPADIMLLFDGQAVTGIDFGNAEDDDGGPLPE